jgi:hypothetical protein
MMRTLALPLMLVLASCTRRAPEERAEREQAPVVVATAPTPVPSAPEPPVAIPVGPGCLKPVVVPPRTLASGWPGLVGKRVRLRVLPVRAIDFTTWLVTAGGQRFVVNAAPDTAWGVAHVFMVAGSAIAPVRGRTSLPELVLDDDCET